MIDIPDSIFKWVHDIPWRYVRYCMVAIIVGLFVTAAFFTSLPFADKYPQAYIVTGVLVFFLIIDAFVLAALACLAFHEHYPRRPQIKAIAWAGYGDTEVKTLMREQKKIALQTLEYVRGIDKVGRLSLENSKFNLLIADVEYIPRHILATRLVTLNTTNYNELWDQVFPPIAKLVRESGNCRGIPLRWGLNDIVVNPKRCRSFLTLDQPSYSDLEFNKLISITPATLRIGLWNWYLPTCLLLLLLDGVSLNDAPKQPTSRIQALLHTIKNNAERFVLFDDPIVATRHLLEDTGTNKDGTNNDVWTVLGGGSWLLLPENIRQGDARGIIPKQGVFMWVECAAIIDEPEHSAAIAREYISALLSEDGQRTITSRPAYRAVPVRESLLGNPELSAQFSLDQVLGAGRDVLDSTRFPLRTLPKDWRGWEEQWEEQIEKQVPKALY